MPTCRGSRRSGTLSRHNEPADLLPMGPIRVVDLRVLVEAACGVALVLALLMPFFTVSAQSIVPAPVKAITSITDAIPQEPLADVFVVVALLALAVSVLRMFRPGSGYLLMALSLASFVAGGALVAVMQLQWSQATSGWHMDAARALGVQFTQSFGFWVFLGAVVVGGGLVITEFASRLVVRTEEPAHSRVPVGDAPPSAISPNGAYAQPLPSGAVAPANVTAQVAGAGRVVVAEAGRSTGMGVALGQTIVLGRDAACDIRMADPRVSRRHASIQRVDSGWVVRDLGATNPTRLVRSGGQAAEVGQGVRFDSGQLLVGDVLVTLYP
jgi:hypothetical protein